MASQTRPPSTCRSEAIERVNTQAPARAYLGIYGVEVLQDCVQIHGGIGVTFDHAMHLYLRRVVVDSLLFGTVSDHRQRLTTLLEEKEFVNA
jgi:alkylation response protein AidB-like acyl-CoA dehydrogenase